MTQTIKLDGEQQLPVSHPSSCVVIAGPGSGKTRILVAKALSVQHTHHICLTFTRNATEEVRRRSPDTYTSTIHSLCYRTLGHYPGSYEELLSQFLNLPRTKIPKFTWVLVDEFQDLNLQELKVVLAITDLHYGNIFLVGDPCQSIFGYQEALGKELIPLVEDRLDLLLPKFYLNNNYRSSPEIIKKLERIHFRTLQAMYQNPDHVEGTAVLFRTNHQLDVVSSTLTHLEIDHNTRKSITRTRLEVTETNHIPLLATIHCTKGLEFNTIIAFDWGERDLERNLYYVATARASNNFHLINSLSELTHHLSNNGNQ